MSPRALEFDRVHGMWVVDTSSVSSFAVYFCYLNISSVVYEQHFWSGLDNTPNLQSNYLFGIFSFMNFSGFF